MDRWLEITMTLSGIALLFIVALGPVNPGVGANLVLAAGALCGTPTIIRTVKKP